MTLRTPERSGFLLIISLFFVLLAGGAATARADALAAIKQAGVLKVGRVRGFSALRLGRAGHAAARL